MKRRWVGAAIGLLLIPRLASAAPPAPPPIDPVLQPLRAVLKALHAGLLVPKPRTADQSRRQLALLRTLNADLVAKIHALETPLGGAAMQSAAAPLRAGPALPMLPPVARPAGADQAVAGPALSIPVRAGDAIRAGCDGRVLYAGPFRSYGQLLILDCGNDVTQVLGGLERLRVRAGRAVRRGQTVGTMPQAAPSLYLEIRRHEQPVDPRPFFRRAR